MKKIIHINQHNTKHNRKNPDKKPVITVKTYKSNNYANGVDIFDDSGNVVATLVYRPEKPLSCGATVWLETKNKIALK